MPTDNNNFWNALLTAGASMYAQGKKKKEDNKQLEWMNSVLADKRRYEEEKVARYKSSPAAQMSPMIMEMLVGAYGPKFKKYGIDMPLDKMLAAINGGGSGPGGVSGAPEGTGGSAGGTQRQSIDDLSSGRGVKWGFQARSDGTFGPANTTMKNGAQYTMGKLDPEIEGYNGKDWGNKLGSIDGDIFGREQTRDGTGGAEWTKDSKGRKVYGGTLATGGRTAYTPSKTTVSDWRDTIVHRGGMDDDNWVPTIEGTQSQDPINIMTGNGAVDKDTILEKISRFLDKDGFLPTVVRGIGNAIMPGGPGALDSALDFGINRGWGDGIPGNAGITKISKRTGPRKRGGSWD